MSDLLKEAIADAKAVRETALANAKMALEEAFTPHLKSMLSAKLAEDEIEEDDDVFEGEHDEEEDEDEVEEGGYNSPRREDDDDEDDPDEGMHYGHMCMTTDKLSPETLQDLLSPLVEELLEQHQAMASASIDWRGQFSVAEFLCEVQCAFVEANAAKVR